MKLYINMWEPFPPVVFGTLPCRGISPHIDICRYGVGAWFITFRTLRSVYCRVVVFLPRYFYSDHHSSWFYDFGTWRITPPWFLFCCKVIIRIPIGCIIFVKSCIIFVISKEICLKMSEICILYFTPGWDKFFPKEWFASAVGAWFITFRQPRSFHCVMCDFSPVVFIRIIIHHCLWMRNLLQELFVSRRLRNVINYAPTLAGLSVSHRIA